MKKLIVILAIVAIASPVMAGVTISAAKVGSTVTVSYTVTGQTTPVRAFALDYTASTGTITAVTCSNSSYYIYPGSIQITNGSVASYGSCVCASTYPGTNVWSSAAPTSAVTVEMGSLYASGGSAPASTGTLFTFTLSNSAATVTGSANVARGGVVMENPDEAVTVTFDNGGECLYIGKVFSGTGVTTLTINQSHLNRWNTLGKPNSWCCTMQKRGNGVYTPSSTATKVDSIDFAKVKNSSVFNKVLGDAGYNANYSCDTNLSGKIDSIDLAKVKNSANFTVVVGGNVVGCP